MSKNFGIPESEIKKLVEEFRECVYCHKKLIFPYDRKRHNECGTIEHLNEKGPFYWKNGLKIEDVVICCGECNSSRGKKSLIRWFESDYCKRKNINENTVHEKVKDFLKRCKEERS